MKCGRLPGMRICSHALALPTGVARVTGENMACVLTEEKSNQRKILPKKDVTEYIQYDYPAV